jgi:hypothetical protein
MLPKVIQAKTGTLPSNWTLTNAFSILFKYQSENRGM